MPAQQVKPREQYKTPEKAERTTSRPKREKGLKRVSDKRAMLNAIVNPGRKGFVLLVGTCMACNQADAVDCHEICRGVSREACLRYPRLWLALCRNCHDLMDDASDWPLHRQVACRIEWEIRQTVSDLNKVQGWSQDAMTYEDIVVDL